MKPVVIENLKKSYRTLQAVKGVSFDVEAGEILGLIGPDGAGKTTIIRILVSLLEPDEGRVWFMGEDAVRNPAFVRARIGYMPQRFSLYQDLTVEENLSFFGDLFQVDRRKQAEIKRELYAFSRLEPFKDRKAGALSGGMKQKLALSCMLMHQPQVLVLDEPTFGVDPVSRNEFWEILRHLARQGTGILVTTAYMDEAHLCDRVGLMYQGEILALDKPDALLKGFNEDLYLVSGENPNALYHEISGLNQPWRVNLFGDGIHITDTGRIGKEQIAARLREAGIGFHRLEKTEPSLEDLFLKLMQ